MNELKCALNEFQLKFKVFLLYCMYCIFNVRMHNLYFYLYIIYYTF